MLAKDIMTTDVVTVTPEASVEEIAMLLLAPGISGVPVVGAEGALVGMVSEGDLIRRESDPEHHRSWWLNLFAGPEERARDYVKSHGHRAEDAPTPEARGQPTGYSNRVAPGSTARGNPGITATTRF